MKLISMVIPLIVMLMVCSSFVAPAEAVTQKVRKDPLYMEIGPGIAIQGWLCWTYNEQETPQGIRWHMSMEAQSDVIIIATGECIGKAHHLFAFDGLGSEDYKEEQNAVVNFPGRDMQGIEFRLKIIFVMQNGEVKVDVHIETP